MDFKEIQQKISSATEQSQNLRTTISSKLISAYRGGKEIVKIEYTPEEWFIFIDVADTDYWNYNENYSLELLIEAVCAYLKDDWKTRKTFLGKREVCFKTSKGWLCTKERGSHSYHYTKLRRFIGLTG
jgi:hypothetical protein